MPGKTTGLRRQDSLTQNNSITPPSLPPLVRGYCLPSETDKPEVKFFKRVKILGANKNYKAVKEGKANYAL